MSPRTDLWMQNLIDERDGAALYEGPARHEKDAGKAESLREIALRLTSTHDQGQVVEAIITSVVPYGAFARLEEGLDGLIHISEMGVDSVDELEERLHEGQIVQARILHIDSHRQRLGLSLDVEEVPS